MLLKIKNIGSSLSKSFLSQGLFIDDVNLFKNNYSIFLNSINQSDNEETLKDYINKFLDNTFYKNNFLIKENVKNIDLSIFNNNSNESKIGVIIETKAIKNIAEMITLQDFNKKAFHELILYYLEERITNQNLEIKHLIITNSINWFIFDATEFERTFKNLQQTYIDWFNGKLVSKNRDWFYSNIIKTFIETSTETIICTNFELLDLEKFSNLEDKKLIELYKIFTPEHLLKLNYTNDSNSLNQDFYHELLHILGLYETKDNSRKIERLKENDRCEGSLLENVISVIENDDILKRLKTQDANNILDDFDEETPDEQLFSISLELCLTWINRIIFLKLLESQLLKYNNNNSEFEFLNSQKIKDYETFRELFFEVLAIKPEERKKNLKEKYKNIPYLNSSLFELTNIENDVVKINHLNQHNKLQLFTTTVLKDEKGKRKTGSLNVLQYLLDFLDSYNFASDKRIEIQEKNKTLINSSVLGLIFEKLNGYKEGSFFTPGYVTMYICRKTIRDAVIQRFKTLQGFENLAKFSDLYNNIHKIGIEKANEIFNSIKICDPAVGSGHFLVSALNELIAIKSELGILIDKNGQILRNTYCEVENDEIYITHFNEIFIYNFNDKESQRIQETIFNEKKTLIENCLFGVDINPKSVQICRLRLWIELLKNAFYKITINNKNLQSLKNLENFELETLPNIDINIKCGNSLVALFKLNGNGNSKKTPRNMQIATNKYKKAVDDYKNTIIKLEKQQAIKSIKELKEEISKYVNPNDKDYIEINQLTAEIGNQQIFFSKEEHTQWLLKIKRLTKELTEAQKRYDDKKHNIYGKSFEWRFEFPEVLDDNGYFEGFDAIVGNPPYIRQEKLLKYKKYLQENYKVFDATSDILTYFIELSHNILKQNGSLSFIVSNKFLRTEYGRNLRTFILENFAINSLVDFGGHKVFEHATVDALIFDLKKTKIQNSEVDFCKIEKDFDDKTTNEYIKEKSYKIAIENLNENSFILENNKIMEIRKKIASKGVIIKDWKIKINFGLKSGLSDIFIINNDLKNKLVAKDKKNEKIFVPILRGKDIKKYTINYSNLWLINSHNGIKTKKIKPINIEKNYPSIYEYFLQNKDKMMARNDKGKNWTNLRNCAYLEDFEKPKIVYQEIASTGCFCWDETGYYINQSCYIMTGANKYILAVLNSKLIAWYFKNVSVVLGEKALRWIKQYVEQIPIPQIEIEEQQKFINIVDKILLLKNENSKSDTEKYEKEIDKMVYKLYELTKDEIKIIENN